jgi:putative hemolysin
MIIALLVIGCLALAFALSGCEAALLSVSRVRVRHAAAGGDKRAARLLPLLDDRDAALGAVTVANHLCSLAAFLLLAWPLVRAWGAWGYAAAFLVGLPLFLVGIEVLPKKLARRMPFRMLRWALPVVTLASVVRPLFRGIRREIPQAPADSAGAAAAVSDLRRLSEKLQRDSVLTPQAAALIRRVLDYRGLRAGDLMTPLRRQVAVAVDVPVSTALELARAEGVDVMPVLGGEGEFAGMFETASTPPRPPPDRLVRQHMRSLEQVRADAPAIQVLRRLRKRGRVSALVGDCNGGALGVIREDALLEPLLSGAAPGPVKADRA